MNVKDMPMLLIKVLNMLFSMLILN